MQRNSSTADRSVRSSICIFNVVYNSSSFLIQSVPSYTVARHQMLSSKRTEVSDLGDLRSQVSWGIRVHPVLARQGQAHVVFTRNLKLRTQASEGRRNMDKGRKLDLSKPEATGELAGQDRPGQARTSQVRAWEVQPVARRPSSETD